MTAIPYISSNAYKGAGFLLAKALNFEAAHSTAGSLALGLALSFTYLPKEAIMDFHYVVFSPPRVDKGAAKASQNVREAVK